MRRHWGSTGARPSKMRNVHVLTSYYHFLPLQNVGSPPIFLIKSTPVIAFVYRPNQLAYS